ncbi:MAG: beta-ketoacyl-[acyl-carrier-protein] synthase family protein [Gammaproteobacteria bacterium]
MVVTGLGVISPLGNDPTTFFDNLMAGKSGIKRIDADFCERLSSPIAASAKFDASAYFPMPKLRALDRVSQFALAAAGQALEDAAPALSEEDRVRTGVFLGSGMGGANTTDEGYRNIYAKGSDRVKPYTVLMAMTNAPASWIGIEYGFRGPNVTVSTACSSSAVAIGEAWRRIKSGETDIMLAGGAEAPLNFGTLKAWEALKTLALEDDVDPSASCKPFAKDRTGLVLGEGAAILVLEEYRRVARRAARIYGEIVGYGLSTDAVHITRPTVEGQARAMRLAIESAELDARQIDYINAHGTGTLQNDGVETSAIKRVFGERAYRIPVSSTKSMHGHLLGAAGAIEFVVTLLAMRASAVPPTINLHTPDPECDLDYVAEGGRLDFETRIAMSNSFAFGGTNAVLIAGKPQFASTISCR